MASSSGVDNMEDALNLQNLYPQSQSPMSFKQIQKAKRQKRVNANMVAPGGAAGHIVATGSQAQSRQSANGSHLNHPAANQNPQLQQFYTVSKI